MSSGRLFQGVKHLLPYVVKSSKGSKVETVCGKSLLDFTCGIGVTNLGHCHEGVTKAVIEAVPNLVHAQQNIMRHKPMVDLIDRLAGLDFSKKSGLDSWFFWNSGAEAVEASVKLARQSSGKQYIIVVNLGYHGRTFGTMSLTTSGTIYRSGFGPLMGGVAVTPFPYVIQGPYGIANAHKEWPAQATSTSYKYWGRAPEDVVRKDSARCLESLEVMLRTQVSPSETAAILLEPVLGEGGYVPCPPGFLSGLRGLCDQHGIMLIADEVQTGFGRTGTMFASEWIDNGVKPDILICAKGIANGFPLSAVATRSELSARQPPGSMGGTYGANAVSCAAALAVLEAFEKEKVLSNVQAQEKVALTRLHAIQKSEAGALVKEVRGKGLMIGVEFEKFGSNKHGETAYAVVQACLKRDLMVLSCGPYDTVRLIPALNITTAELEQGLKKFHDAIEEVYKNGGKYVK